MLFLVALPARAQLTIEIIGGGATQTPIAIVPFVGEADFPLGITGIVGADLQRSGLFRLVEPGGARPANPQQVNFADYRASGAEAIVIGTMASTAPGNVNVRFFLIDAVKQTQITAFSYNVSTQQFRTVAHTISDVIYEALTGDKGVFSTRIAYIVKNGRGIYIFSTTEGQKPIHHTSLPSVFAEIAKRVPEKQRHSPEPFQGRDIRRSIETRLQALGVSREVRAQLLSHGRTSGVQQKHYERHDYLPEKTIALAELERHLFSVIESKPRKTGETVPRT